MNKKPEYRLTKIIRYLRPYQGNIYIRLTERREQISKEDVEKRLGEIRTVLPYPIVEIKRQRKNNHYYICSKRLLRNIKEHYEWKPTWDPLSQEEIYKLKQGWDNYE